MTRGILLVDHGSRRPEANAALETLAEELRRREPDSVVGVAHLEVAAPTIAEGLAACVRAGATEIVVHPFFLTPGRHTREDVPREVTAAAANHPEVRVVLSPPLGPDPDLAALVLERVAHARDAADG